MNSLSRRDFLKLLGATTAIAATGLSLRVSDASIPPRIVVVGGGFGGATVAKYLKLWGGNVNVTLIDSFATHTACILSNLVLTGAISLNRITLPYDGLRNRGVQVLQGRVVSVDPVSRVVELASGATLPYDRLIFSPGIDFMPFPGWDPDLVPHAWQAGSQTLLLMNQLRAMTAGGTVVVTVPKAPYRCPPGPYERSCVIADYLQRRKPGSKLIVLDANPDFLVEPHNFGNAFYDTYSDTIEYITNVTFDHVDSGSRTLYTSEGNFHGDVLNLIPEQQAGKIVRDSGLANASAGRWAAIDPRSYESTLYPGIHVIGDSQATGQAKSGHMASSQAKVCADAILRSFAGYAPSHDPVTNSACYTPVSSNKASWLSANYQYNSVTGTMQLVPESFGEARKANGDNYEDMFQWADNIFTDSFG